MSSTGIGEVESGTLTTILKKGERSSKTERARRGNCSRVNIGEMLAKGIPVSYLEGRVFKKRLLHFRNKKSSLNGSNVYVFLNIWLSSFPKDMICQH